MTTHPGKWSIRFYRSEDDPLPCETHDGGDKTGSAEHLAVALARVPERAGLICHLVNTRPSHKEKQRYDDGKGALRWRLDLTTNPEQFIGIERTGIPILV